MASPLLDTSPAEPEVVDLSHLAADALEPLWEEERRLWLRKLYWDVTPVVDAVRSTARRRRLDGKAALVGGEALGYSYYMVDGHRAVVGGLVVTPQADPDQTGPPILYSLLRSLQSNPAISRIESQFVNFHGPWLTECFVAHGFDVHPRAFLRRALAGAACEEPMRPTFDIEVLSDSHLYEASLLMQKAHAGKADARMNELYRSENGCRSLLQNLLYQKGCGKPIGAACFVAREPAGPLNGLVISTEISPGHAHLAQVAVCPSRQGQGLGRYFLVRALTSLEKQGYRTVSLMVSGSNQRAYALYHSSGFGNVLGFPVFSWDRPG